MKLNQILFTASALVSAAAFAAGSSAPKQGITKYKCEAEPIYTNQNPDQNRYSFSSGWKLSEQEARDEAVYNCMTGGVGMFGCDEGVSCRAKQF
jgi:hypothetical protein